MADQFPRLFIEIAVPKLRQSIQHAGLLIAQDDLDWGEAMQDLAREARRYGMAHLPSSVVTQTMDWLTSELLKAIDSSEQIVAAERARSDQVMRDLHPHFVWCASL